LMTNGHAMSATWPLSQRYMRALAHVPLLMIDNPTRALVIGFGVGNTTQAATLHPSIERVEVADLSRNVLDHASWFGAADGDVFPESVLLSGAQADLILIGANTSIQVDPNQLFTTMSQRPAVREDLRKFDLGTPREIAGMFVGSSKTLADATRGAVPVTDDRP